MMMEKTHYLPDEELNFRNYPEIGQQWENIQALLQYGMTINTALAAYNAGTVNKVDVDANELSQYVSRCRETLDILGNAPKVCFDILLELRELQYSMQELLFAANRFGSQYVGTPTTEEEGGL